MTEALQWLVFSNTKSVRHRTARISTGTKNVFFCSWLPYSIWRCQRHV